MHPVSKSVDCEAASSLSGSLFNRSVTLCVKKVLAQIGVASLFLQLKWVASFTCFTLLLEKGTACLLIKTHLLYYYY